MGEMDTPSAVMYEWLKRFGHINKADAASALFDASASICGGRHIADLTTNPPYLSRYVVHSAPGDFSSRSFRDFRNSAQDIISMMLAELPKNTGKKRIVETFGGPASQDMVDSLDAHGRSSEIYRNTISFIMHIELPTESDRATLLVMLFIATGCTGDPSYASTAAREFSSGMLSRGFQTMATEPGVHPHDGVDTSDDLRIALWRIVDRHMEGNPYRLSTDPEGTVIGSLPEGKNTFADVGADVSKNHLRIWRDGDGRWLAQGLGSTNGTTLVSGADQSVVDIELPRVKRQQTGAQNQEPVELLPSDMLCLAGTTTFMIVSV